MAQLVAIAGPSGGGKGTIADLMRRHMELWGLKTVVLSTDDCYKDRSYLSAAERDALCFNPHNNFDHPDAVDFERLLAYAKNLKAGSPFRVPKYNFVTHSYDTESTDVEANVDVAFIEGIYALYSGASAGN